MKIMAIDYGTKNIGLALSDNEARLAFAYTTLKVKNKEKNWQKIIADIKNICQIERVQKIIIGMPLWLTGESSKTSEDVFNFAKDLEKEIGLPLETIDERLSTVQANRLENKNAKNIDELSAQIILQSWLDKNR